MHHCIGNAVWSLQVVVCGIDDFRVCVVVCAGLFSSAPQPRPSTDTPSAFHHYIHTTAARKPPSPPFRFFPRPPSTS